MIYVITGIDIDERRYSDKDINIFVSRWFGLSGVQDYILTCVLFEEGFSPTLSMEQRNIPECRGSRIQCRCLQCVLTH